MRGDNWLSYYNISSDSDSFLAYSSCNYIWTIDFDKFASGVVGSRATNVFPSLCLVV